jgi:hypothetical protein
LERGRNGEVGGQFTSNLGSGWTGQHHAKEGFQVSKKGFKGKEIGKGDRQGEIARGVKKANCAITLRCQSMYIYKMMCECD